VHVQTSLSPEFIAEFDRPIGIGELVAVDTTVPVDVAALAEAIRSRLLRAGEQRERGLAAGSV
jgi:hypothetical protein